MDNKAIAALAEEHSMAVTRIIKEVNLLERALAKSGFPERTALTLMCNSMQYQGSAMRRILDDIRKIADDRIASEQ